MRREFQAFAEAPTRDSYLAAFQSLLARSPQSLTSEDVSQLLNLLESGQFAKVARAIADLPPIAALSPAVHQIAAQAARQAGDESDCELEQFLLAACLKAILDTGDGTPQAPYVVACPMDERHICEMLGLTPRSQGLAHHQGKAIDVIECTSGATVCFDVSSSIPLPAAGPLHRQKQAQRQAAGGGKSRCLTGRRNRVSQTPR